MPSPARTVTASFSREGAHFSPSREGFYRALEHEVELSDARYRDFLFNFRFGDSPSWTAPYPGHSSDRRKKIRRS
jgi:hypothetical protein